MASTEWMWGVGIIILGLAIAFALMRNRSRTASEKRQTEAGTEDVYRAAQRKEDGKLRPEDRTPQSMP
ncbi:hypothetical protein RPB_3670 [Rhodopseudomonas palustris HaA2]|uniref:Uncharacterized protein n=1 Tax=Rhodopseudomonas palustris (strain HaA2) TaxID=316058 RepID=Q2ITU5_RHOP2|nr:hypothetical protein [Rhodopseudomonas palustris]ABD08365.1 hypothetical protein RPB_3670 [Rhodopseudomonas palustris HaA2]